MKRIYLDNAATTPLDESVLQAMLPYLTTHFGNPSSIYSYGRETRLAIENARKSVAKILKAKPSEIFFTSGGTESSNTAIKAAIENLHCTEIITAATEHHATLHTVQAIHKDKSISLHYVPVLENGHIDTGHLETLLQKGSTKKLVSLMHANNEIGNLLDIEKVAALCEKYAAIFHCDTVQTVGHLPMDLSKNKIHFITGAAHKFHGPKGVGLLYINENIKISPLIVGGGQERNMRAGTENVYGIVGFAKALELATTNFETEYPYILGLKKYFIQKIKTSFPLAKFNGDVEGESLYTVLNVNFPKTEKSSMLLYGLDMRNICVSGGSACSSGADAGSHVINALNKTNEGVPIRFSFSKYNTEAEIDEVIEQLYELI